MMYLPPAAPAFLSSLVDLGAFWLGPDGVKANPAQMILRSIIVYSFALLLVRLAHTRSLGRNSGIDIVLTITLGSVLSRGINGSAALSSTIAASLALIGLHWIFVAVTFRHKALGKILKGHPRSLIENGRMQPDAMHGCHVSDDDLYEALRIMGKLNDVASVETARLERNGDISVIERKPARRTPRILEVSVTGGVQTIRIELE